MLTPAALAAAALTGFLGGAHCVGMCGPIVATIQRARTIPIRVQIEAPHQPLKAAVRGSNRWPVEHLGRLVTYGLLGAVAGGLTDTVSAWMPLNAYWIPAQAILFGLFNLFIIFLGLEMLGYRPWSSRLLAPVADFWRLLRPRQSGTMLRRGMVQRYLYGAAWGMVPCGLVYSVLPLALLSARMMDGALLMLAFGLGTMPALLIMGWSANRALHAGKALMGATSGDLACASTRGQTLIPRWIAPLARLSLRPVAGTCIIIWGLFGLAYAAHVIEAPGKLITFWCSVL